MKLLTVSSLLAVVLAAAPMRAPVLVTFKVDGMKNKATEALVENELKKIPGVAGVKVTKGTVQVAVADTGMFKLAALKQVLSDLTTNEKEPLTVNEETTVSGSFQLYVTGLSGDGASKLPDTLKGNKAITKADPIAKAAPPQGKAKAGRPMEEGEAGNGVNVEVKGKVKIKDISDAVAALGGSDEKPAVGNIIWVGPKAAQAAALAVGGKGGKAAPPVNTTPVNSTCPVKAGRDVDAGITAVYQGKTYAFC